jgi:hypothetical protein
MGFCDARSWADFANRLIEFENSNLKIPNIINVTCQYEFISTNLLGSTTILMEAEQ